MHLQNLLRHINKTFWKHGKVTLFPGECWALVIWASTPPLLRRTARNMRYWLAGYLPCCLDIYYHRHIMVLRALVMMVLSGSKYYAGNLMAIINILKDKAQFPSIGWDVKYKSYKRKVQWCNVMVCTDLIGYSTVDWSSKLSKFDYGWQKSWKFLSHLHN